MSRKPNKTQAQYNLLNLNQVASNVERIKASALIRIPSRNTVLT